MHTLFFFIFALALLITVHEYGHFIVARKLGIKVEKFSIGFGPALFSWRGRDGEVEYVIAAIPLGGYVKMLGENPGERDVQLTTDERARAFDAQPVWKRAAVAVAGPLFNFAFAVVAYMMIAWLGQEVYPPQVGYLEPDGAAARAGVMVGDRVVTVDGVETPSWHALELALKERVGQPALVTVERGGSRLELPLTIPSGAEDALLVDVAADRLGMGLAVSVAIAGVQPGAPAEAAGVRAGDRVVAVDGVPVRRVGDLIQAIQQAGERSVVLRLQQPDEMERDVTVTPKMGSDGKARIGVRLVMHPQVASIHYRMGFLAGVGYGIQQTWSVTVLTWQVLTKMVRAVISPENLGGPIAIAQMAGKSAELGLVPFIAFLALISVNLGVLNLLPIPVLDGGHLLYLGLEKLRGRALSPALMEKTQMVGAVLIGALMLFAFYNDIARWLRG